MPKLNPYLIENKKPIELVQEIENKEMITPEEQAKIVDKLVKNEIPSYEEFMKTYQEDGGVIDNYYYEIDSYGDIRVVKCYGPGFWDEIGKPLTKFTMKAVGTTFVAGSIIASGGATAPLLLATGTVGYGTGKAVQQLGKECDNEWLEYAGDCISDTGANVLTGTLAGTQKTFKSLATVIGESSGRGAETVREFQQIYDKWEKVKDIKAAEFHTKHVAAGIKYHSWCGVCN